MATVNIYDQGNDTTYNVSFNLKSTLLSNIDATGETDFYLDISTTMKKPDNTAFEHFIVRNLSDIPPGYVGDATSFSNLCSKYMTYFMDQSELIASSSSSSNSSSSSSSQSESSSSSQSQ